MRPQLGRAVLLAPLFAPLSIVVGSGVRGLITTGFRSAGPGSVVGVVLLTILMIVYGAPLAYGATIVILWPLAAMLRDADALSWWSLTIVAAVAGGVLFPLYLHALTPRGTWDFFPGAGIAAGAATGWGFWFIATRRAAPDL